MLKQITFNGLQRAKNEFYFILHFDHKHSSGKPEKLIKSTAKRKEEEKKRKQRNAVNFVQANHLFETTFSHDVNMVFVCDRQKNGAEDEKWKDRMIFGLLRRFHLILFSLCVFLLFFFFWFWPLRCPLFCLFLFSFICLVVFFDCRGALMPLKRSLSISGTKEISNFEILFLLRSFSFIETQRIQIISRFCISFRSLSDVSHKNFLQFHWLVICMHIKFSK